MYYSTNLKAEDVTFRGALLRGQAPDMGLYLPREIPQISQAVLRAMPEMTYPEVANAVTGLFLNDEVTADALKAIVDDAYTYDVPVERAYDDTYILRLDRGPTCSFKDFAARMMARLMRHFLEQEKRDILILTATSGDTGSAIAHAFHRVKHIQVVVLFPREEVSDRQRKQMTTLGENVTVMAVDGKFDDCQAMVKEAFADPDLEGFNLSSANSINIGRLLPQAVYYFYAYSRVQEPGKKVVFSVPSGNFGDIMGGLIARHMGLPVDRFVVATNENDEFPRFVDTGVYDKIVPSRKCISNAMNVGHPSNLARLIALYGGQMDHKGDIHEMPDMDRIRSDMYAVSIDEDETRGAIKEAYDSYKVILEPHGAVGWAGLHRFKSIEPSMEPCISLETAHPAKFPEEIVRILGVEPEAPPPLSRLAELKEEYGGLPNEYSAFKGFLKEKFGGGA
jgi:threonine synthase